MAVAYDKIKVALEGGEAFFDEKVGVAMVWLRRSRYNMITRALATYVFTLTKSERVSHLCSKATQKPQTRVQTGVGCR